MRSFLFVAGVLSITLLSSTANAACHTGLDVLCYIDDPGTPQSVDCMGSSLSGSDFPSTDKKLGGAADEGLWAWKVCGLWQTNGRKPGGGVDGRIGKPCGFMMVKNDCPGGTKPPGEL